MSNPENLSELARDINKVSHLLGTFTLRSGLQSSEYFDKYLFESDPKLLKRICFAMVPLVPKNTDILGGLELGGVPIATVISQELSLPMVFIRKCAKEYGTRKLVEGGDVSGLNVTLIEDIITSGGAVISATGELRNLGASVTDVVCAIDRQQGGAEKLQSIGLNLHAALNRNTLGTAY